jgi:outer membrane protein assembly factor BamB
MRNIIIAALVLIFVANFASAEILSQWRGPERDGIYPNESLLKEWPASGPKLLWRADGLGIGFSSPAVTQTAVYVTSLIGDQGWLFAYDHGGKMQWKTNYGPEWDKGHKGTRTTPTVVDDKIYLISGVGDVVCLNTAGKVLWKVDMKADFGAKVLHWGISESALVDGDIVYCTPGGSKALLVALDRQKGTLVWKINSNGEASAYCSPRFITHNGKKLLITMTQSSVAAVDPSSGDLLWKQPHVTQYDINPNTVLYKDNLLFTFSGYGTGSQLFRIADDGMSASKLWANETPDNQMAGAILLDGYVYSSGHKKKGWACSNWTTGDVVWQSREHGGKGPVIFSDGLLYYYSEKGDVVLVKPNSKNFEPISSFKMEEGSGAHWAHPVIKNGRFYVRHGDVMHVYDIAIK